MVSPKLKQAKKIVKRMNLKQIRQTINRIEQQEKGGNTCQTKS